MPGFWRSAPRGGATGQGHVGVRAAAGRAPWPPCWDWRTCWWKRSALRVDEVWPANYNLPGAAGHLGQCAGVARVGDWLWRAAPNAWCRCRCPGLSTRHSWPGPRRSWPTCWRRSASTRRRRCASSPRPRCACPEAVELKDVLVRQMTSAVRFSQSLESVLPEDGIGVGGRAGQRAVGAGEERWPGRWSCRYRR